MTDEQKPEPDLAPVSDAAAVAEAIHALRACRPISAGSVRVVYIADAGWTLTLQLAR